jgi:hypothetical protein
MAAEKCEPVSPAELRSVLEVVIQANEALVAQNQALQQLLKSTVDRISGTDNSSRTQRRSITAPSRNEAKRANSEIWTDIFHTSATSSEQFMKAFYDWKRPESVQQLLSTNATWTSWTYAAAFPHLSRFLKRTSPNHRCHCQVDVDDLLSIDHGRRSTSYKESRNRIDVFWEAIKDRTAFQLIKGEDPEKRVSARLFKIVDLSPLVLTALLGSTPQ